VRRWGQKLHTDALASFPRFTQIHHPAFLFFQSVRIDDHQHFAVVDLVFKHKQTAVAVYHHGLASLFELFSVVGPSLCLDAHPVKDASASAGTDRASLAHKAIIELPAKWVNCPSGQVFPKDNSVELGEICLSA